MDAKTVDSRVDVMVVTTAVQRVASKVETSAGMRVGQTADQWVA